MNKTNTAPKEKSNKCHIKTTDIGYVIFQY